MSFLPLEPINDNAGRMRNGVVFVIFLALMTFIGYRLATVVLPQAAPEYADPTGVIAQIFPDQVQEQQFIGGDITVPAPVITPLQRPERIGPLPDPARFSAKAMIVKDLESGTLLYNRNAYEPRSIASLTKLMSALVVLEKDIDWSASATVVGADSLGTHMYAGDTFTLEELWQAGLVASSNKAVMTLVSALEWPEEAVVERMRQKAQELGMTHTTFADTTGLAAGNKASASDIAILLDEAIRADKVREALLIPEVTLYSAERKNTHRMYSTNWLLLGWIQHPFAEIIGGKTGYTPEAGYNFAFQVTDEQGNGVSVVVMGAESHEARFTEARDIAQWALENHSFPTKEQE